MIESKSIPNIIVIATELYSARLPTYTYRQALSREEDINLLAQCVTDASTLLETTEDEPIKH